MSEEMQPRRREGREDRREEDGKTDFFSFLSREGRRLDAESEAIAHSVIGAAIEVHRALGPGLSEVVYRNALSHEFELQGIDHVVEAAVPVMYKGKLVGEGKVDLLVAGRLVVELKVVEQLGELHRAQVIAYLSALHLQLGLLINFNVPILTDGLRRIIRSC